MPYYNLYLDESETYDISTGTKRNAVFSIAGVIIETSVHDTVVTNQLNTIKQQIWVEKPDPTKIVLHEKTVREVANYRNRYMLASVDPDYHRFMSKANVRNLYQGIGNILVKPNTTTLGACVRKDDLATNYPNGCCDVSLICMQIIIENFCHFLSSKGAKGYIFYESISEAADNALRRRFNMIESMGTMYVTSKSIQSAIVNIQFPKKTENIAGLQLADFIPNIYARHAASKKLDKINIYQEVRKSRYDGAIGKHDRFGIKILP